MFMMYAPYLPLRERIKVNGWVVLPVAELDEAEYASERPKGAAPGLARPGTMARDVALAGHSVRQPGLRHGPRCASGDVDRHCHLSLRATTRRRPNGSSGPGWQRGLRDGDREEPVP
jgi:hypothetical protein